MFALAPAFAAPPATPLSKVTDTYQGIAIDDPYRGLEQLDSPAVQAWARAQGGYTRAALDALPGRAALQERIDALSAKASDRVYAINRVGRSTYFMKKQPTDALGKLYVRTGKAADRILFDPDTLKASTGQTHAINNYAVSPDGKYVALVLSVADAELGAIHVLDTKTGTMTGEPVPRIWGELRAIWMPDGERFIYTRSGDPARAYGKNQMIIRRVGSDGKDDQPLLGYDIIGRRDDARERLAVRLGEQGVAVCGADAGRRRGRPAAHLRAAARAARQTGRAVARSDRRGGQGAPHHPQRQVAVWPQLRRRRALPRLALGSVAPGGGAGGSGAAADRRDRGHRRQAATACITWCAAAPCRTCSRCAMAHWRGRRRRCTCRCKARCTSKTAIRCSRA
ncbi:hypothetical protein LP420_11095 [Massilia sp. B-10]|nr:hypothetical protein LP420_11095 [Massilia sp. B-10]